MPDEPLQSKKTQFAIAIAQGIAVSAWARTNEVPRRTAFRWASEMKVRSAVETCRRRALDRAVGRMATRATWAVEQIAVLAKVAESESVRLSALRSILSDMMAVSKFAGLEDRVTEVEELVRDRITNAGRES